MTTYRVYAKLANSDDALSALIGDAEHLGYFSTTTNFFQHAFGGVTPSGINPAFLGPFPSLAYDSWVTIGIEHSPVAGEGAISILEEGSEPWVQPFEAGMDIDLTGTVGGGWYTFTNYSNSIAGDDLEILIGQFTTYGWDSQIYGSINLQGRQGDFESFVARDQYFGWVPAPATMVLVGLACLQRRRRL